MVQARCACGVDHLNKRVLIWSKSSDDSLNENLMNTLKWVATLMALSVPFLGIRAQTPDSSPPPPENGTAPSVSPVPSISTAASDVVRMAEAGTSEDVLVAYVKNSNSRYDLSADQILYLRDVGLTSPVITAMLNRDSDLKTQPQATPTPAPAPLFHPPRRHNRHR